MTRSGGKPNPLEEIAQILVDGFIILRSKEDSPPDRKESPEKGQNVDSQLETALICSPNRVMDDRTKVGRRPKLRKGSN